MVTSDAFSKTICTICYEDLKPVVEDLQVISICGHVFHELCLQQWFEYTPNAKKHSCPVCKQGCNAKTVCRLYFQSTGDMVSQTRTPDAVESDPEVLRREVKRLETKISGLSSALDSQLETSKQLSEELHLCKEQLSREMLQRIEVVKQKEISQETLRLKSSELVRSTAECSRLQEKNLALAKELASVKLVSDCNLDEEEIVKLASLGNESNRQDSIDILKKSLVIRNKSYKDLMAKCNTLGREEARSVRKLEKAKAKIVKLKAKVQELEISIETKDNEALRMLKHSMKEKHNHVTQPSLDENANSSIKDPLPEDWIKQTGASIINLDDDENENIDVLGMREMNNKDAVISSVKGKTENANYQQVIECEDTVNEAELKELKTVRVIPSKGRCNAPGFDEEVEILDVNSQMSGNHGDYTIFNREKGASLTLKNIMQVSPSLHSKTEASVDQNSAPVNHCFVGGLLGPDGANRYLGKWCKRNQNKGSATSSAAIQDSGNGSLISVGADGRGGRVKILRSLSQSSTGQENAGLAKKCKLESRTGSLQIEHFFGRTRN